MHSLNDLSTEAHDLITLTGSVVKIIFQNHISGYYVLVLEDRASNSITAAGTLARVTIGMELTVRGRWKQHPKFGKQFEIVAAYTLIPTSLKGLAAYLSSGIIKGVGDSTAQKLLEMFGTQVLAVIEHTPEKLRMIPGLAEKRIATIQQSWAENKDISDIMIFLQDKGISNTYATKLYRAYGARTIPLLCENPYRLIDDIWGISFIKADIIAQQLGVAPLSAHRISAAIKFCLRKAAQSGHLYLTKELLYKETEQLLGCVLLLEQLDTVLHQLYQAEMLVSLLYQEQELCGLMVAHQAEKNIARILRLRMSEAASQTKPLDGEIAQKLAQEKVYALLSSEQQSAVLTALTQPTTIITGGPGTGKTTLVGALLAYAVKHTLRVKLAAPTGRAAQRITEKTKHAASTLHRLLEFSSENGRFTYGKEKKLAIDLLIVDECSMIDITLADALIQAITPGCRLVMIGDIDQLPPVGPGNFLKDCIESGIIPTIRLTQIFRQAKNSLITLNAHRIRAGHYPLLSVQAENNATTLPDYLFIEEKNADNLIVHLRRLFTVDIPLRGYTAQDVMVLSPMHKGTAGTVRLNQFLQEYALPHEKPFLTLPGIAYKLHDRVMQITNKYEKNVFNGDIGHISSVNIEDSSLSVSFYEKQVSYTFNEIEELTLAYATTIHKSQGSEFPIVIIPLFMQHFMMLKVKLLYTAVTRAQKLCVVIGEKRAIALALKNRADANRMTLLTHLLQDAEVEK